MDMRTAFPRLLTNRLEENDLKNPMKVVIDKVDGEKKKIYLKESDKILKLNLNITRALADITNSWETDNWVGAEIEIYWDSEVTFGKKKLGGIRVRRTSGKVTVADGTAEDKSKIKSAE